jgi:hypothetical protein
MDPAPEKWMDRFKGLQWRMVVWWCHRDLRCVGIDTLNLLCARDLPGAQKMNLDLCLNKIEAWAAKVKAYTAAVQYIFDQQPDRFGNSVGYFKALCLVTCLQQQCGVRYNHAKREPDSTLDVPDSFLFGIVQGNGGTCASLPVLYCAVGHRLHYPMYLAHTHGGTARHTFVIWQDEEVRFNIEATGEGMGTPPDDHYRTGRFQMSPEIERKGCFLKPNDMRQSLAGFLADRATYCRDFKDYQEAAHAMSWATALHPENEFYFETAKQYYNEWVRTWKAKQPQGFPDIFIKGIAKRRFPPTVPLEFELDICGVETMECLLRDPRHERNLWGPLRRGETPANLPLEVECEVFEDGRKSVSFLFKRRCNQGNRYSHV